MQRHRRRAPGKQKRGTDQLDYLSEAKDRINFQLKHRQLKAELELMRLENKLNKQIGWLQTRRLDQLKGM